MVWCAAAWHLKDRDEAVGWDAVTRWERLKLVVQLRRFLVLEEARRPNLASQCLGAGMRELVEQWSNLWLPTTSGRKLQRSRKPCGNGLQSDELDAGGNDEGVFARPHRLLHPQREAQEAVAERARAQGLRVDERARVARSQQGGLGRTRGAAVRSRTPDSKACATP